MINYMYVMYAENLVMLSLLVKGVCVMEMSICYLTILRQS